MANTKRHNILVLTALYPDQTDPAFGIFIHEQIKNIKDKENFDFVVISPRPFCPFPLNLIKKKWAAYSKIKPQDTIDGISVYYPRYLRFPGKHFHALSAMSMYIFCFFTIRKAIKSFDPLIIHAHEVTPAGLLGCFIKMIFKIPLVCTLLGSDINSYPYYNKISFATTKIALNCCDVVISISQSLASNARHIANNIKSLVVVRNGIDTEKFRYVPDKGNALRNSVNIKPKDRVILFVGHLIKPKGVYELIEAFCTLNREFNDIFLFVVGFGIEESSLKTLVKSRGLENKVFFWGNQKHDELPKFYSSSDIFVLPSHSESLSTVVAEALACEKPAVASNVGGIPEIIKNGYNGLLVEKENPEILAGAVKTLLENEESRKLMGKNGRQTIIEYFSEKTNKDRVTKIYRNIMGANSI